MKRMREMATTTKREDDDDDKGDEGDERRTTITTETRWKEGGETAKILTGVSLSTTGSI